MFLIDRLILLAAVLLLAGIVSSKFSARMGLPVLVLFLGIGMLAGEDGIGGIEFDNVTSHTQSERCPSRSCRRRFRGGLSPRSPHLWDSRKTLHRRRRRFSNCWRSET
jgi:hypothetical protein